MAELSPEHFDLLSEGSAIDSEVIEGRGYETITWESGDLNGRVRLKDIGMPSVARRGQSGSGILVPIYGPLGECVTYQWRPDEPVEDSKGNIRKYVAPFKQDCHLDVHPSNTSRIKDENVPLIITEGVKKADALTSKGMCAIALSGVFNWRNRMGTLGDWEDVVIKNRRITICFDSDAKDNQMVLAAMERLHNWLIARGAFKVKYLIVPKYFEGIPVKGVDDFFVAGGSVEELMKECRDDLKGLVSHSTKFTDAVIADQIAGEVLESKFVFTGALGWLKYNGKYWETVDASVPLEAVRQYVKQECAAAILEDKDQEAIKGWKSMLNGSRMKAVLDLCKGIEYIRKDATEFDSDPDVLNVRNGLLDLRTGSLRPHSPEDYCMKMAKAEYRPGLTHDKWNKALEAIPEDVREWAQLRYGQAITGHTPDDAVMVIEFGGGANGKSTIVDGIRGALGSYYRLISNRVLLATGKGDEMPTEAMDLMGLRFAQLEETPEARRLDVNKMKQSVGASQITARPLYQKSVTFDCTHTLFITTNNIPIVNETDHGSWRRLALLKFPFTFHRHAEKVRGPLDRLGDGTLKAKVERDPEIHSAALAWLVEGAKAWYAQDQIMPNPPHRVEKDTDDWRKSSDLILKYFDEKLTFDPEGVVATKDLLTDMNEWLKETGHHTWSIENLTNKFLNHDHIIGGNVQKKQVLAKNITSRSVWMTEVGNRPWCFTNLRFQTKEDGHEASA